MVLTKVRASGITPTLLLLQTQRVRNIDRDLTSQRIAHWVKDLLKAGVDTELTQPEVTSNTADWRFESTFKKFYYHSSQDSSSGTKVLSSEEMVKQWNFT